MTDHFFCPSCGHNFRVQNGGPTWKFCTRCGCKMVVYECSGEECDCPERRKRDVDQEHADLDRGERLMTCDCSHEIAARIIEELSQWCPELRRKVEEMDDNDFHNWIVMLCHTIKTEVGADDRRRQQHDD